MNNNKNAALILADGTCFFGCGFGARGQKIGELCFNTSITGYQEVLTDPSYLYQIIVFTFPMIGIVGTNDEDNESDIMQKKFAQGLVVASYQDYVSNHRSKQSLNNFLISNNQIGIEGIDTRALTIKIRDQGVIKAALYHCEDNIEHKINNDKNFDLNKIVTEINNFKKYENEDLASLATQTTSSQSKRVRNKANSNYKIAVIDFGAKANIVNSVCSYNGLDNEVSVFSSKTPFEDILAFMPDGIVLSNGPGDPVLTYNNTKTLIDKIANSKIPCLGICIGFQLLALSLCSNASEDKNDLLKFRKKMKFGHRGINHPVLNLQTKKVEITSQNHGYEIKINQTEIDDDLMTASHISLFDKTLEGFFSKTLPIIAVQFHPESSPGPHDSHYIFDKFFDLIKAKAKK